MTGLTFSTPWLLALLPLALAGAAWRWWRPARQPVLVVANLDLIRTAQRGSTSWRARLHWVPGVLRLVAIVLLILAVARPQRGLAVTRLPEEGIDVVLALDVSGSMLQRTPPRGGEAGPVRLDAAKAVIEDFVESIEGDRAGLVAFQSRALMLSPLTLDHEALLQTVRDLQTGLLPEGTAIGLGLGESVALLQDSPARSRVIVLLTDGENNAGEVDPIQAARLAEALDIRVYTIAFTGIVGDEPSATALARIAELTGADAYTATTEDELARAYETIGALERSRIGERQFTRFQELAPWLLGGALGLLVIETVLRTTVWRRFP